MILQRLYTVLSGRHLWLRIKRMYSVDNGIYVLLMPEDDAELNEQALRHIDDFVAYRKAQGIVILTCNSYIKSNAWTYSDKIKDVLICSPSQINKLIAYNELYSFSEKFIVVSLTKPYGRSLYKAIGVNGVTKEDLVCLGIFLIRNWTDMGINNG